MSMSVYVDLIGANAKEWCDQLDKEFKKIHNQDFRIDCNFQYEEGKLVSYDKDSKCEHGLYLVPKQENPEPFRYTHIEASTGQVEEKEYTQPPDFEPFITIPCHWDYAHMVQTEKDIRQAVENLGLKAHTRLSW